MPKVIQLLRSAQDNFAFAGRRPKVIKIVQEGPSVNANRALLLIFFGALVGSATAAHQSAQNSSSSGPVAAKIKCQGGDWVNVTFDAEQSMPLQVVDKASCNEEVTVLSDPQEYTVKIRTASGKVGYVTRFEVAVDPNAVPKLAPIIVVNGGSSHSQGKVLQVPPADKSAASADAQTNTGPHKPRVYVSDSQSWSEVGGFGNVTTDSGQLYAGYNPDMVDIYQDFTSDCKAVTVVQDKSNADYAILFDKGASKKGMKGLGGLVKVNKITVLSRSGETLLSDESRSEDTAVRMACTAITQKTAPTSSSPTSK